MPGKLGRSGFIQATKQVRLEAALHPALSLWGKEGPWTMAMEASADLQLLLFAPQALYLHTWSVIDDACDDATEPFHNKAIPVLSDTRTRSP